MPTLTQNSKDTLLLKCLEVFRLHVMGSTLSDACATVGISEYQYRYWTRNEPEAIAGFKAVIEESEREQLSKVVAARQDVVDRLIAASQTEVNPSVLISIDTHLMKLQGALEQRYAINARNESAASAFLLTGPRTTPESSKLGHSTINVKPLSDGSVDIQVEHHPDIIDAE